MKTKRYYFECSVIIKDTQYLWALVSDIDISCEIAGQWLEDAIRERTGADVKVDRVWISTRKSCLEDFMIVNYVDGSL